MQNGLDEDARILHIDVTGLSAVGAMDYPWSLLGDRPDLWQWDWIIAITELPEQVSVGQVGRQAERYATLPKTDGVTVLMGSDARLQFWATVLEFQFPGRKRLVATDRAEALALIQAHRAGTT